MAVGAHLVDRGSRGLARPGDRQVLELGLDGRDVAVARTMAAFAANGMVRSLGAGLVNDRMEVRRVAEEAATYTIAREHRLTQVFLRFVRTLRKAGRQVPTLPSRRSIVRHPDHPRPVRL